MKSYHKTFASFLLAAITLGGCAWDHSVYDQYVVKELDDSGNEINIIQKCPEHKGDGDLAYIELKLTRPSTSAQTDESDEENSTEEVIIRCAKDCIGSKIENCVAQTDSRCQSVITGLEKSICPKETACRTDTDTQVHYCGIVNSACSIDSDCEFLVQGWKEGRCSGRKCIASSCDNSSTHLYNNTCEPHSADNCGEHGNKCNIDHSTEVVCNKGKCQATKCEIGFHVDTNNHCEKDTVTSCNHVNCKLLEGWKEGSCDEHAHCVATSCDEDYQLYNKLDGEDFVPCFRNTTTNCGGENCEDKSLTEKGHIFMCMKGKCTLRSCEEHYHRSADNQSCTPDTPEECGFYNFNCKALTGVDRTADTTTCNSPLTCHVERCALGYHRTGDDGIAPCEADTNDNCGEDNKECKSGELCTVSDGITDCSTSGCVLPQQECKGQCINTKIDPRHCGSCEGENHNCDETIPNAFTACTNGQCSISSCKNGYILIDNQCIKEDISNCGSVGKCEIEGSSEIECRSGTCVATQCEPGYHIFGTLCEKDTTDNCNTHGNNCQAQLSSMSNVSDIACNNGECSILCNDGFEIKSAQNGQVYCKLICADHAKCSEETHAIVSCDSGYHLSDDGKQCNQDSNDNCGSDGVSCLNKCIQNCSKNKDRRYQYCISLEKTIQCRNFPHYSKNVYDYDNQFEHDYKQYKQTGVYYIKYDKCPKKEYYKGSQCIKSSGELGVCQYYNNKWQCR